MKKICTLLIIFFCCYCYSQTDTIDLKITISDDLKSMFVEQKSVIYNDTGAPMKAVGLHAWMNAYSRRLSTLSTRMLEDRNSGLYFSDRKDRGQVERIESTMPYEIKEDEFVTIPLKRALAPKDTLILQTNYEIKIPESFFTNYGREDKSLLLKYFILQPSKFYNNGMPEFTHYIDLETLPVRPTFYRMNITNDFDKLESNIPKLNSHDFKGFRFETISLVVNPNNLFEYDINGTEIAINYNINLNQQPYLDDILRRQIKFLEDTYDLDSEKLLITFKTKKLQNFTGIEDIKIVKDYKIKLFTQKEQIDLKMFQMLCYEALRENMNIDLEENHWILHGFLVYMQMNYIEKYYPNLKLAGHLPEDFKFLGMKPLKWFFASDLNLTDRYKLAYLYIVKQNYEQDIDTKYSDFNNINKTIISAFKSGLGFNYLSDYIGKDKFDGIIKEYFNQHSYKYFDSKDFENYLQKRIDKNIDWFFNDFIRSSDKLNFSLKKFKVENDSTMIVKVENRTDFKGPFKLVGYRNDSIVTYEWLESNGRKSWYNFPLGDYDKLVINPGYTLAEFNYRDNYLYTTGVFKNSKKVQPKLYADIEDPEYEQIFFSPKVSFNNYDKFILGMRMSNHAFFNKQFEYSLSPSISTGTTSLTGSGKMSYSILPEGGIFRNITLSSSASYYHYDRDLPYLKISNYVKFEYKKDPRSAIRKEILMSYDIIDKRPNPLDSLQNLESLRYNLFKTSFLYKDDKMIFEHYFYTDFQAASLFAKVNAEWYGRYEYLYGRKIMLRWFGSMFLFNNTETDYFDTGISDLSDYSFGYSLLARSDNSGIFSQQYVMAEGGFIAKIPGRANQWITTLRTEVPIWKQIEGYGSIGLYKDKYYDPKFIYEIGIKLRLIPDFFELYLPVQSTIGFEFNQPSYLSRIRFVFNFNIGALKRYFQRGWF